MNERYENSEERRFAEMMEAVGKSGAGFDHARLERLKEQSMQAFCNAAEAGKPDERSLRIKMIHRVASSALAASIILTLGILVIVFRGGEPVLAIDDIEQAFSEKKWLHVILDKPETAPNTLYTRETWTSLINGDHYTIRTNGDILLSDSKNNIQLEYNKRDGSLTERMIMEPAGWVKPNKAQTQTLKKAQKITVEEIPAETSKTAWQQLIGIWNVYAALYPEKVKFDRYEEVIDDRKMIRFEAQTINALGEWFINKQIWVDVQMRLPVRYRQWIPVNSSDNPQDNYMSGRYEYPETGPGSIYDLGVPAGLKPVKIDRKHNTEGVQEILDAGKKARNAFGDHYRMVRWGGVKGKYVSIDIWYRKGNQLWHASYPTQSTGHGSGYAIVESGSVEDVLQWAESENAYRRSLYTNEHHYMRQERFDWEKKKGLAAAKVTVTQNNDEEFFRSQNFGILFSHWGYHNHSGPLTLLEESPDTPEGCVTIRHDRGGDTRRDFIIDPNRDYICIKTISWKKRNNKWRKNRAFGLDGFVKNHQGRWHASSQWDIHFPDPQKGKDEQNFHTQWDVKLMNENDYPEGLFSVARFTEGAVVEGW